MTTKKKEVNLSKNLAQLSEIANWFDQEEEVDVEAGLEKVREAAVLIKESKGRLGEIENEFEIIKKDIEGEIDVNAATEKQGEEGEEGVENEGEINPVDIPF